MTSFFFFESLESGGNRSLNELLLHRASSQKWVLMPLPTLYLVLPWKKSLWAIIPSKLHTHEVESSFSWTSLPFASHIFQKWPSSKDDLPYTIVHNPCALSEYNYKQHNSLFLRIKASSLFLVVTIPSTTVTNFLVVILFSHNNRDANISSKLLSKTSENEEHV